MATKKPTKKDLEAKIAELEAKINKLSADLTTPEASKPAPKPEAKPAEPKPDAVLPKGTQADPPKPKPDAVLPKGTQPKPDAALPKETKPKPAEAKPPATFQDALENAYRTAPMSDFHQYRAKVTGYSPAPNRYFVRLTSPVGNVPTSNWNEQKAKVTGYTQPSNQYFATRARLAYHPPDKTFGSFSGTAMSVDGIEQLAAPEPAKPAKGTLPKGF